MILFLLRPFNSRINPYLFTYLLSFFCIFVAFKFRNFLKRWISTSNFDRRTFLSIFLLNVVRRVDDERRCRLTLKHLTLQTFASRTFFFFIFESFFATPLNQGWTLSAVIVTVVTLIVTRRETRDQTNPRLLKLQVLELGDEREGEGDDKEGEEPLAKSSSDRKSTSPVIEAVMSVAPRNVTLCKER